MNALEKFWYHVHMILWTFVKIANHSNVCEEENGVIKCWDSLTHENVFQVLNNLALHALIGINLKTEGEHWL